MSTEERICVGRRTCLRIQNLRRSRVDSESRARLCHDSLPDGAKGEAEFGVSVE
jgi:hypothetical protein